MRIPATLSRRVLLLLAAELVIFLAIVVALMGAEPGIVVKMIRVGLVALPIVALMALTIRTASPSRSPGTLAGAGALGLLLGIVGLAAGSIVGVAGFAVAGPSPLVVFGLLILVSGVALTIAGAAWWLRSVSRWWRLLAIPVAYLVLQFWTFPVLMAVLGTHAPRARYTAAVPADAQRVDFSIPGDGARLVAWYTPSKNGAAVIVLPGAGSTKSDTAGQAAVLTKHGYGVLALDMRGTGESDGQSMLWGWGGVTDVEAAYRYLSGQPGVNSDRIGVLGLSMGAEVGLSTLEHGHIRSAVAEGATARSCGDLDFLGGDMEGVIHRFDSCLAWSMASWIQSETQPSSLRMVIPDDRPFFLIAADLPDEHAATEVWHGIFPMSELWEPAGATHTGALAAYPAEWERRVIDFFDRTLQ